VLRLLDYLFGSDKGGEVLLVKITGKSRKIGGRYSFLGFLGKGQKYIKREDTKKALQQQSLQKIYSFCLQRSGGLIFGLVVTIKVKVDP